MTFNWFSLKYFKMRNKLTYVAFVIFPDMNVLARRLNLQKVSEDLLVNLEVGHSDREVTEVILVQ